mgnify:CR=1 FL=1
MSLAYYAVIFTSQLSDTTSGYEAKAEEMLQLARGMPGFLGVDSARSDGKGITVSYWESLVAIDGWRNHPAHLGAKRAGKATWYSEWKVRIARVEGSYE